MIATGIDQRVQVQQIIENQLPEFILSESPKTVDFFKQYYVSQEYPSGPIDIVENLDQYLKLDNLTPEVIKGYTNLIYDINESVGIITVCSTKGFPDRYGLIKIDDEIITYTGITTNTFTGCIRGFSGITDYHKKDQPSELVFSTSSSASHTGSNDCTVNSTGTKVENLSSLFLKEFYQKLKAFLTPGLEDTEFVSDLDVNNFIKSARSFYQAKGTPESFRILFNILYGETPKVIDLEKYLIKPSYGEFIRRENLIVEKISGDPIKLVGQSIFTSNSSDPVASVSSVEIIVRGNKNYYKIGLFVGYEDVNIANNRFGVPGKTKVLETVNVGSEIISVDSTIGFPESGTLISGSNKITYTDKSINQFFGCSGITEIINVTDDIRSTNTIFGYEDGDTTKKVELRITGVISNFIEESNILFTSQGEKITVKNLGEVVPNPEFGKTDREVFANYWIYNTSCRYQILSRDGQTLTLKSDIDSASLKIGDEIEILERASQTVASSDPVLTVSEITPSTRQITIVGFFELNPEKNYDLRRKIKKSSLEFTGEEKELSLEYGDNKVIADVQNVYVEGEEYGYVASNSLPEYPIDIDITYVVLNSLENLDGTTQTYSDLVFEDPVPFNTGDIVVYESDIEPLSGLENGESYYVRVMSPPNIIRLYNSKSFIGTDEFLYVGSIPNDGGTHKFILQRHLSKLLSPQKILRKFPLSKIYSQGLGEITGPGPVGMAINGVEIISPRSTDKIYYGPIEKINILNPGRNYDVINPPSLSISESPNGGTDALANLVVSGSVHSVLVEPQDFDISNVISVTMTGGNGTGAIFNPVISKRFREVEFNVKPISFGGGIDFNNETITFISNHNFQDCERVIYNSNGYNELGIGSYFGDNTLPLNEYLVNGAAYYVKIVNSKTIKLHKTLGDCYSGINTIGFSTSNTTGNHKFRGPEKNTLSDIKVINPGSGYENRKVYVKPSGISTSNFTITFKNHNLKDGDIVEYVPTEVAISGLSSTTQYQVLKLDNDQFRLCDIGIGSTSSNSNYTRKKYQRFYSQGSGYHIFKYPNIELTVTVSFGSSSTGIITATPIVRGSISDVYLYEPGTGYGSEILNLEKKPILTIKNGKNAEIKPIIVNGRIISAEIISRGTEYQSTPDLIVSGDGSGALIKAVVSEGKLVDAIIIKSGIGYSPEKTSIRVSPPGINLNLSASIRQLSVNESIRSSGEILIDGKKNIQYAYLGYPIQIGRDYFQDVPNPLAPYHSPIIGWAYDGNPIYGPYGYSDPSNGSSSSRVMESGYVLDSSDIVDRPTSFNEGFFVDDYKFNDSGDLDEHNGRFCITPEFPKGIYAYFATVSPIDVRIPVYPYFIGDTYRSLYVKENNLLDQSFDFNNSNLIRNTFPYKINDQYANNDFLIEPNEFINQVSTIESVFTGKIDSFQILSSGEKYKVGDSLNFNEQGTGGGGLSVEVSSLEGKEITKLETTTLSYPSSKFIWNDNNTVDVYIDPYHNLLDNDFVNVSGLTTSISNLYGSHIIGVSSDTTVLLSNLSSGTGIVTDIYISNTSKNISIGSSLQIENEVVRVLNVFPESSLIRIKRSDVGTSHTSSTNIYILPNKFTISTKTNFFDSRLNDLVYFNPKQSVGLGTTVGVSGSVDYTIGNITKQISIPTQSIYLPNHPFKTGQEVTLNRGDAGSLLVKNTPDGTTFNLPNSSSQVVYIINKSKDYIGITTQVGLTTNTGGVYFVGSGDNFYDYYLESNYTQVSGNVEKINTKVSVSTAHNLQSGDSVSIKVYPSLSLGIGNSDRVRFKYNSLRNKILINPIGFSSSGINTTANTITINSHNLKTGDKVFYTAIDQVADGLDIGDYFVYKIDDNKFNLTETYYDSQLKIPSVVNIIGIGGSRQEISLINPQIVTLKNNNLVLDLSDPSISDYNLKLYYDKNFNDEFVSTSESNIFNVVSIGNSTILNYAENLPKILYYAIEKDGEIISSDFEVINNSQIYVTESEYNGTYSVFGVGSTSFNVSLRKIPEKLTYFPSECDSLTYTTTSLTANGGVNGLKILSKGTSYRTIPEFVDITSEDGQNAVILPISNEVGRIKDTRILEQGFEYPSDKTLRPEAYISPSISIINSSTITDVELVNPGSNYISAPSLVIIESESRNLVSEDALSCETYSGSIKNVSVNVQPFGLKSVQHEVIALNNTNGVYISTVSSDNTSIRCFLSEPLTGFTENVFETGDEVFVENIEKQSSEGTGFNSKDNGYKFYKVLNYIADPAQVVLDITGVTTNPGIAKTIQDNFPLLVKRSNYPTFQLIQNLVKFKIGEQLLIKNGDFWSKKDLYITNSGETSIKVNGTYQLSIGEIIKGSESGVIATIESFIENKGRFDISYSVLQDYGWTTDIGKLNESSQVTPDNDYYQNLSYTVKSSIEFERSIDPINRLLHTSGLKNFADTEILSSSKIGIGSTGSQVLVIDVIEEKRIDTINNFDFGIDVDVINDKSKSIKLQNKKLTGFINCVSNRVLVVDDVSPRFLNRGTNPSDEGTEFIKLTPLNGYFGKYLIQIVDLTDKVQFSELVIMNDANNVFTLEKSTISNTETVLADLVGEVDEFGEKYIKLSPTDIFNTDLNIKIFQEEFNTESAGIGTTTVGFVNLIGSNSNILPGTTKTLVSFDKEKIESVHIFGQVFNIAKNLMQYVELFVEHDGTDAYYTEYYFDNNPRSSSDTGIGTFSPTISSGKLNINFYNDNLDNVLVKTKVVGFGTTAVGNGVYRFKTSDQLDGTERSARVQSNYVLSTGISTTILAVNSDDVSSVKSTIRVSYGDTSSLHQVMMITNGTDVYTVQYPFLSIGSTTGIGTFGGEFSTGSEVILKFYPDSNITESFVIQSYNEILYTENDEVNIPLPKEFGTVTESIILNKFDSINGLRINRLDFDFNYKGTPIYAKTFNPSNSNSLDLQTGIFTINNHFFSNGEELIYKPKSTIFGVNESPLLIPETLNSSGILTTILPSDVYVVRINDDQFKLATRKEDSIAGISVTFTSYGSGNAHSLEMSKKLEKTVISIDGIVQKPVTFNPIAYSLQNNVSASSSYFGLSGISTIKAKDLLKIDDEFARVIVVGFGSTSDGPIGAGGSLPIVNVQRGFVGTAATSHNIGTSVTLYRGAYNIVGNKVHFTDPPTGSGGVLDKASNLPLPKSSFSGRVYLRQDYTTNQIYDDIAYQFTGIGQTYTLTVGGANTTGITTGDGILFINNIFQTPTTANNTNNSYSFISQAGISSVVFSGVSTFSSEISVISESDVNQNILPRGGLIVSLGSTPGLGFAPLVGVSTEDVKITLGPGNSIQSVGFSSNKYGSGYYGGSISIGITDPYHNGTEAVITATIGAGGSISQFNVISGGTGYQSPYLEIPAPSYSNLPVVGVSRLGIGSTSVTGKNLLVTLDVGPSSTTGIGSTLFEVKAFSIARPGYSFKVGDVFKPVGLVTASGLSSPLADFELTVTETFEDDFYAWQFGEFDYIDSIKPLQNGSRTRFPLFYNGELRSFEKESDSPIDLNAVLIIFINGVLQQPGESYIFEGGTSFIFTTAPRAEDRVSVFFYRGTRNVDSFEESVNQSLKIGDTVQLLKDNQSSSKFYEIFEPSLTNIPAIIPPLSNNIVAINTSNLKIGQTVEKIIDTIPINTNIVSIGISQIFLSRSSLNNIQLYTSINVGSISTVYDSLNVTQDPRTVTNITSSDLFDTNIYGGVGINDLNYRPLYLTKQKTDKIINGEYISKSRDSLEPTIYPSARIIRTVFPGDKEFFVDSARFFDYETAKYLAESLNIKGFDMLLVNDKNPVSAALTATVSIAGTIQALNVVNVGSGYTQTSLDVKIGVPTSITPGVGERATATVQIVNGSVSLSSANITNPGYGYTVDNPPQVIVPSPNFETELISRIGRVEGFSGIVTGITTAPGVGTNLALKFFLRADPAHPDSDREAEDFGNFIGLTTNYPIYIYDTNIGSGVTSIDLNDSQVIGIGTTFLDNIYQIHSGSSLNSNSPNAEIICNVHSQSAIVGLGTTASNQFVIGSVGKFSWGRITGINLTRLNPISIGLSGYTASSGLSTFPTLQRRKYGLRETGALDKISQNSNN